MPTRQDAPQYATRAQLATAARPVPTMVLPDRPQQSSLHELVGALEKINPVLRQYAYTEIAKASDEEVAKGKVEFAKNQMGWKQAVDKGVVPEGANPHFRRGWRLAELQNQGRDYGMALREAYEKDPIRSSDDPEAVKQWTNTFTSQWIKDNVDSKKDEAEVAEALLPSVNAQQNILYQRHTEERIAAADAGYTEQLTQGWSSTLETYGSAPVFDPEATAGQLQTSYDEAYRNGMNPAKLGKAMTDAVVAHAVEMGDPDILETLNHVKHGSGPVGKTTYAKDQIAQAKRTIFEQQRTQERFQDYKLNNVREETDRQLITSAVEKMHNGNFDVSTELGMAARVSPKAYKQIEDYRDSMLSNRVKVYEQPAVLAQMYEQIANNPEQAQRIIMNYANQGLINPASVEQAIGHARRLQEEGSLRDPIVKKVMGNLQTMIAKSEDGNPDDQFSLSTQAMVHFTQHMADFDKEYKQQHKGASPPASVVQSEAVDKFRQMTSPDSMWMNPRAIQAQPQAAPSPAPTATPAQPAAAPPQGKPAPTSKAPQPQQATPNVFDQFDQE